MRIAVLGFHLESNAFAAPSGEREFRSLCYVEGEDISREARKDVSSLPAEIPAFYREMDKLGAWTPVPILVTACEPGGPVDEGFFQKTVAKIRERMGSAGKLDGVYISNHGGMVSTAGPDPDGELYAMVRAAVGPKVPVVATVDLHANISERMVENVDALVSYRTNPHMDQAERAVDAARLLRGFVQGKKSTRAFARLPLTPASVTLLTREGPYADAIKYGQTKVGNGVLDVSIVGGFVFSDTPKNGVAIVVNGEAGADVHGIATDIAERIWSERKRFVKRLTSFEEAFQKSGCIWSDAGDNPGGGGTGQTTWLLKKLCEANAQSVLYGVFFEPQIAAAAREAREITAKFTEGFSVKAKVLKTTDGQVVGRRGIWAGRALDLGPTCALQIGGVTVVCVSKRKQCADPVFFEMHGLDIAAARTVVVKSRGHFRGGFDEFFPPERVIEVDTPGLTSPVLERLQFKGLPRPVFPLDAAATWTPRISVYE
jgi:microcystin degradation protein MlrC